MEPHIVWIVFIKIVFYILVLVNLLIPDSKAAQYKDKVESVFFVSMALLIIYVFNPRTSHPVTKEEKYLLFLFGIIILITTNWKTFIYDRKNRILY